MWASLGNSLGEAAEGPRWVTQILRRVPRTDAELVEAFEKSRNSSIQVPVGDPLETPPFSERTTYDVTLGGQKQKVRFDFSRQGALTFGLSVNESDQANLPAVSKRTILERVNGNYISIQVRVQRDVETGAIYLYYKPFAAIGSYTAPNTHEFSPLMEDSVRDLRGIGLFVPSGTPVTAEALRTFVAVNKTTITDPENRDAPNPELFPHYELLIARAVVDGDRVTLHTFCTTEWRTLLHYLKPYEAPKTVDDCGIKSVMLFTDYSVAKQSPSAMAQRHTIINPRSTFEVRELDTYISNQGLEGGTFDHLTTVLDAIIADKVAPSGTAATSGGE
jgi:hypothetical protein